MVTASGLVDWCVPLLEDDRRADHGEDGEEEVVQRHRIILLGVEELEGVVEVLDLRFGAVNIVQSGEAYTCMREMQGDVGRCMEM